MREKKVGDLKMVVHNRPGKRGVENLLHTGLAPVQVFADPRIVGGMMIREVSQGRPALAVEPACHPCEVTIPGCVRQIVGHGPDLQQHRKQMGLRIRERVYEGPAGPVVGHARERRRGTVQYGRIEIKKRLKESCAIVQRCRRALDQTHLELHTCL